MATREQRAKKEAKRQRRFERREVRWEQDQRKRFRRRLRNVGIGIAAIAAIGVLGFGLWFISRDTRPGESVSVAGAADHSGQPAGGYSTFPPTSGPHTGSVPDWGEQDALQEVLQVHGLEHGGVLVQYNCPTACGDLVQQLRSITSRFRSKVILAPYSNMDTLIGLTSWGKILLLDEFDREMISEFVDKNRNHAPESNQP